MVAGGDLRRDGAAPERGEGRGKRNGWSTAHPGSTTTTETATGVEEGGGAARVDEDGGVPAIGDRNGGVDEVGEDTAKPKEVMPKREEYLNEEGNVERDTEWNEEGNVERDAEGNEEEASGSHPFAGQKRAHGQRGAAKKIEGRHIITEVDEDGRPSAPVEAAKNYIHHSGWVVRDNVLVSKVYWHRTRARGDNDSFVPESEKEMLWTTMLETFTLPAGTENIVKQWTLKKMAEQFQSFKGDLYKKYILKGLTPNFDVFPKLRDHWDKFVAYKTGQQGQAMMVRNKENAAKKKYHHHLGSGGYSVAMPKWGEMEARLIERGIEPATAKWPDRSKFWSRMRSKRDTEAKIADLEYMVSSYELSMQEEVARKVDERMAAHRFQDPQPYIPPAMVSPSGNHSSCASTGQVASGMAIPTDISGTYHCRPIPAGYSRVEVELVEAAYEDLELDYPGVDSDKRRVSCTISSGSAISSCTISSNSSATSSCTISSSSSATSSRTISSGSSASSTSTVSPCTSQDKKAYYKKSKPVPQLGEQPNQQVEPLVTGEEFGITDFISDTALTVDQLIGDAPIPKAEVAYKFELDKPLVTPEQLQSLPTQMFKFHERYMEMSDKGREMFGARIRNLDLLQGEDVLWIHFKDVFDLYHLDALNVSSIS
uniref:Transposon protein, putative, CACTA, En/Spm sub-class n=1 Tax=Oryza sativa subsp. japonica TaxID=39947 RepID=Q33A15_ORYSJ|nr:transposon protein, putative, CACTA, En/Spm sub-class [Oryza sativa Japonica Group]